jgi:two-component system, NarL family, sensor histidine kinase UhpB
MSARRELADPRGVRKHARILIASLTLGCLATAGAVWWYYNRELAALEQAAIHELAAVCDNKVRQVANWRAERLANGHVLMSSPLIAISSRILSGQGSASDRSALVEVLTALETSFLYSGGALTTLDGRAILATDGANCDKRRLAELARAAAGTGDAQLSDLNLDSRGKPLMALTIGVGDLGAIILDIDPARFLYPYLRAWPGSSQTAETMLMRREGPNGNDVRYLSDLRYHPHAPLRFRRSSAISELPPDGRSDSGLLLRGRDYRGVPVFAVVRRISDSTWYLSAKADAAEVDAPGRRLGWEMALIVGLVGLVNIAGIGLVWRGQRARILKERERWIYSAANDTPAYLWLAAPEVENSFINMPLAKFLGTDQTPLAKTWIDYVHPDDMESARAKLLESLRTQTEYAYEFRLRRSDGEYRWMVSKAMPRFSRKGVFLGFAGALLDVTGRRLAEQQLRETNTILAAQLAESTTKEEEIRNLSARLIDAQEEERKRLARELHDDLSQQIAALSIATGSLKRQLPETATESRNAIDRLHSKLVQLASSVRRLSHELHPAILEYSGLGAALRSYCEQFDTLTGIQVSQDIQGSFDDVSPSAALCLFRVTQEALNNVARHARVSAASVELKRAEGILQLTVADAGVGFATGGNPAKGGLGLLNIRERVRLVHGEVAIGTRPGQGTIIVVRIPEHAEGSP